MSSTSVLPVNDSFHKMRPLTRLVVSAVQEDNALVLVKPIQIYLYTYVHSALPNRKKHSTAPPFFRTACASIGTSTFSDAF